MFESDFDKQLRLLHEGFPLAYEISKKGYNAFVIRYRSLWGGSAGARMAARLSSDGTQAYCERDCPKPATAVILYTGHSAFNNNDPPAFTVVGERDGIASPAAMERRVNAMRAAGIVNEFHRYPNVGHGFALGTGTTAEGWLHNAVRFWERNLN